MDSNFIEKIEPISIEVYQKTGVLPSITIAQAILETGGELKNGLAQYLNFFGEKGSGSLGSVSYMSAEQDQFGNTYNQRSNFKKYGSYQEAAEGRVKLLNLSRYNDVRSNVSFLEQAKALKKGGYATDVAYVDKLRKIYNDYKLFDIDAKYRGKSGVELQKMTNLNPNLNILPEVEIYGSNKIKDIVNPKRFVTPLVKSIIYSIIIITLIILFILAIAENPGTDQVIKVVKKAV